MPHISIKLYPGRDDKKKDEIAAKLRAHAAEDIGCPLEYISLSFQEVGEEDWEEKVVKPVVQGEDLRIKTDYVK